MPPENQPTSDNLPPEMMMPAPALTGFGEAPEQPVPGTINEEQKKQLLDLIEKIRGKIGEANAMGFAGDNKFKVERSKAMQQVFAVLKKAGVDLTNPQAVGEFIEKLRQRSPDLAQLFEQFMEGLLSEDGTLPQSDPMSGMPAPVGPDAVNQNAEAPSQEIRGPVPGEGQPPMV